MKAKNYGEILKARGFKLIDFTYTKYQGTNVFVKEHKYNRITCYVEKDSHGKGQNMSFSIVSQLMLLKQEPEAAKQCKSDYEYLVQEANKIYKAFEQLKNMKAPKHLYCFG